MRKILHIADLHLGFEHRYLGDRAGQRAEEALQTLERLVEWALDDANEVAAVLIAGDLFETHEDPDPRMTGRVISTLKRLTSGGRTLVTVPGNHDEYSYPRSIYREHAGIWPGVLVTNPQLERVATLDLDDARCAIYSMAYTAGLSPRVLPALSPSELSPGEIRLALLHGTLDADPNDRSYRIDSQTLIDSGFAYAALGHIHKPGQSRLGDGLAVYPGTLNGKGFDDPGVGELVLVSFPGGAAVVEEIPFPVRPIRTLAVDLSRFDTQEDLIRELERELPEGLILRLEPFGSRPEGFDPDHLIGRLRGRFFHVEVNDQSLGLSDGEIERLAEQPTIRGMFTRLLRERMQDEAQAEPARLALMKGLAAFDSVDRRR